MAKAVGLIYANENGRAEDVELGQTSGFTSRIVERSLFHSSSG